MSTVFRTTTSPIPRRRARRKRLTAEQECQLASEIRAAEQAALALIRGVDAVEDAHETVTSRGKDALETESFIQSLGQFQVLTAQLDGVDRTLKNSPPNYWTLILAKRKKGDVPQEK